MPETSHTEKDPFIYRFRIMGSIIVAELLFLALVHFWPIMAEQGSGFDVYDATEETQIQAPVRTVQQSAPPPPPAPPVPIPVPNDEPIEEVDLEFPEDIFSESLDSLSTTAGEGEEGDEAVAGNPEVPPRIIRIEEPTFEDETPKKADIYIDFLVDKQGNVEEAILNKILMYDEDGNATIKVDRIDNEVLKKTIKAALNWKFQPAKVHGEPVRAWTTNIFTVDY